MKTITNFKGSSTWAKYCLFLSLLVSATVIQGQTYYYSEVALPSNNVSVDDMIRVDYASLYSLNADLENGIIGIVNNLTGRIDVKVYDYDPGKPDGKGIEIYAVWLTTSSPSSHFVKEYGTNSAISLFDDGGLYFSSPFITTSDDIKKRAQDARVYGPGQCNYESWTDLFKSLWIGECVGEGAVPVQPVVIEVKLTGTVQFKKAKIPGIGVISLENNKVVKNDQAEVFSFCATNPTSDLCQLYDIIRNPDTALKEDFVIAAHRGWWGYDLGTGVPENTKLAVQQAYQQGIKIVEMDLTMSSDSELIFMHDYVMKRLTDYPGPEFSFDLPWSTMANYKARKRNDEVSTVPLSRFDEVLNEVRGNEMIMMVDVKEQQSNGVDPNCLANCGFQDPAKQKESWAKITRQGISQAKHLGGTRNLVFKTYFSPEDIYELIGEQMYEVLWTPIIVPNNFKNAQGTPDINLMIDFVDKWNSSAYKDVVACYETNFFSPNDIIIQSFTKNGTTYDNLLHYIHAISGRRSGIFSEEPVNPKGTVNRWGKWKMKNSANDIRGDFLSLHSIPYGKIMVITTDRLDVWKQIKAKY